MKYNTHERGIALLITLLVMTVLLGVSSSLLNITLKQFQFSGIGLASEISFQAANAGMECVLYHEYEGYPPTPSSPGKFDVGQSSPTIRCMGSGDTAVSLEVNTSNTAERRYQFSWGNPAVCTDVTIYKFFEAAPADADSIGPDMFTALGRTGSCAEDVTCTIVRSRGYNTACPTSGNSFSPRTIERELTQRY